MKRVFIIHGLGGKPTDNWYPWLKDELQNKGMVVDVPQMPDADMPNINQWVSFIKDLLVWPNTDMYIVAHGLGSQAVLRYLEGLRISDRIGGLLLVGGFVKLNDGSLDKAISEHVINIQQKEILQKWLDTPIQLSKASKHAEKITSIFSENDPYVSPENAEKFRSELGSKIVMVPGAGHFAKSGAQVAFDAVLDELLKLINMPRFD